MAKKKVTKPPPKSGALADDGSPIIISGGSPIPNGSPKRDKAIGTSSVNVGIPVDVAEPHHLGSRRTAHRVSMITVDGVQYPVSNNDWSICIRPQMTIVYSEQGRMTVRAVSKEG